MKIKKVYFVIKNKEGKYLKNGNSSKFVKSCTECKKFKTRAEASMYLTTLKFFKSSLLYLNCTIDRILICFDNMEDGEKDDYMFLKLKFLKLPKDVIVNSGKYIKLFFKTADQIVNPLKTENIIVIVYKGRTVKEAYVGTPEYVTLPTKTEDEIPKLSHISIKDIPGYKDIVIPDCILDVCIKHIGFNKTRYTMVCEDDKGTEQCGANWLY